MEQAHDSLRRRVRTEVEMAMDSLNTDAVECKEAKRNALASSFDALEITFGQGGTLKRKKKEVYLPWLCGQMYRTMQRLVPEPEWRQERARADVSNPTSIRALLTLCVCEDRDADNRVFHYGPRLREYLLPRAV